MEFNRSGMPIVNYGTDPSGGWKRGVQRGAIRNAEIVQRIREKAAREREAVPSSAETGR